MPHVRDGKLVPLVVNDTKRAAALPEVPTTREAGFADAEYPIWFGLFVPAKTPRAMVETLHREVSRALQMQTLRERLASLGVDPVLMSPTEFDAHIEKKLPSTPP